MSEPPDDLAPAENEEVEDRLDEGRIRRQAQLRRATYRSRSYAIIAATACVVMAAQLGVMIWRHVRSGGEAVWTILYASGLVVCLAGGGYAWRRAVDYHREASRHALGEPEQPPDFSTLSDGSQRVENLHRIR